MLMTCLKTDNLPLTVVGLCPLLMVANSMFSAMIMGTVFLTVLMLSNLVLLLMRYFISPIMRFPMILLLNTLVVALVGLVMSVFCYEWHLTLGIYIPLLSMNFLILVNAEENVLRNGIKEATGRSLILGLSIWGILSLTGFIRDLMTGLISSEYNFVILGLAPGAFLVLGFIIALIQFINIKIAADN